MPRNAGGTYTLPAGNPVTTGTIIQSTWANPTLSDVANELTNSLDRAGRGSMTAPLKLFDGVVGAPGLTWNAEPTSGWYRISAGVVGISLLATLTMQLSAAGIGLAVGQYAAPLGAVGAPSYSITGDLNTGMYSPGADQLAWSTAGVQRGNVNSTGGWTLNAPTAGTLISGTAFSTQRVAQFSGSVGNPVRFALVDGTASTEWQLAVGAAGSGIFSIISGAASGHTVQITTQGNVTVNAPSSGTALAVAGVAGQVGINFVSNGVTQAVAYESGSNALTGTISNHPLLILSNNTVRMVVAAGGGITFNAPSSGDTVTAASVSGSSAFLASDTRSGGLVQNTITNLSNTANSDARQSIVVAGSSAGDAYTLYSITSVRNWGVGVDNSDSDTFKIDSNGLLGTTSNWLNVTTDGRWYGIALHNNAGAVTGTTNQYAASGTWIPSLTNNTNITSSGVVGVGKFIRFGNVVTACVSVTVDPTTASILTQMEITLPIASNFAATTDCIGVGNSAGVFGLSGTIIGTIAGDRAQLNFIADAGAATQTWQLWFQYEVL